MVKWDKDPAFLLLWLGSLLWRRFNFWPRNFHTSGAAKKKKKKKKNLVSAFSSVTDK